MPVTIVSTAQRTSLVVRVTSQPTLGQTGTLSDLYMVDDFALAESLTDPGYYQGVSNIGPTLWTNTPGTYYWQAFGFQSYFDPGAGAIVCHAYAGPVYTINVVQPAPTVPPIAVQDGRSYAVQMVQMRTGARPRLTIACTQADAWTLRCSLAWRAGSSSYTAAGRFWHFLSKGTAYWTYDFAGTRTWRTCVRRHRKSRCTAHRQSFRWH